MNDEVRKFDYLSSENNPTFRKGEIVYRRKTERMVEEQAWGELLSFLKKIPEGDPIHQTSFFIDLYEKLRNHDSGLNGKRFVDSRKLEPILDVIDETVDRVAMNNKNIEYIFSLAEGGRSPKVVDAYWGNRDDASMPREVEYYPVLANSLIKRGGAQGIEAAAKILFLINEQVRNRAVENYGLPDEEKKTPRTDFKDEEKKYIATCSGEESFAQMITDQELEREFGYQPKSKIIKMLGESQDKRVVKWLLDFLKDQNGAVIYIYDLIDAFEKVGVNQAAGEVSREMRLTKDKILKKTLQRILYRLEFGQVGISEEGVKYLERIYDLGEYNNPNFHVSRLTASGEVGVFDEEAELIKYFHLGDLSTEEKKVRAKVLDFTYETIFVPKEGETKEEKTKRLQYLEEFKKHYYQIAQDKMFQETGVRLNNLSFREQGWFVIYFDKASDQEKEKLRSFLTKYGEDGLRTFFSLEFGGEEMGQSILEIGNNLETRTAERIFSKYGDVVRSTENVADYLRGQFGANKDYDEKTIDRIIETVLRRGKDLLASFAKEIKGKKPEQIAQMKEALMQKLAQYQEDAILFGATFRSLFKGMAGQVNFSEIKGLEFSRTDAGQLTEEEKKAMLGISRANWGNKPSGQGTIERFKQALGKKEGSAYWLLKKDNEILSFMRFDQTNDPNRLYAASFNVNPKFQNSAIGEAMLETAFRAMARNYVIEASANPADSIIEKYLAKYGFVITNVVAKWQVPQKLDKLS